jgi:hypothetical protein
MNGPSEGSGLQATMALQFVERDETAALDEAALRMESGGFREILRWAMPPSTKGRIEMILTTTRIEDFERFWRAFSTRGAEKRKQHGSKGSHVFRDPNDDHRVWVIFDWDEDGFRELLADPDMPAIFEEGGVQGRPQLAELAQTHET